MFQQSKCSSAELAQINTASGGLYALIVALSVASLMFQRVLFERVPHEVARLRYDPVALACEVRAITRQVRAIAAANIMGGLLLATVLSPCHPASSRCYSSEACRFWFPTTAVIIGAVFLLRSGNIAESSGVAAGDFGGTAARRRTAGEATPLCAATLGEEPCENTATAERAAVSRQSGTKTEALSEALGTISDEVTDLTNYI